MTAPSFPCGLVQPENSFRFSADALLLAAFADRSGSYGNALDLGCGCGVVAFSLLLRRTELFADAVELQPELAVAARENARLLGLENRFDVLCSDVDGVCHEPCIAGNHAGGMDKKRPANGGLPMRGAYDLVVANPPYRLYGRGRQPAELTRRRALFGTPETLASFCRAASRALKPGGRFCVAFAAHRLVELLACLESCGLGPRTLLCVHGKADRKADFVLVGAKKGAKADLAVEAPLVLNEGSGGKTRLTEAALAFCPELGCNAGRVDKK